MKEIARINLPPKAPAPAEPQEQYDVRGTGLCGPIRKMHGKEIPPELKFNIEFEMVKEVDWKERLQLLCGYNLKIKASILTRHNPGVAAPACMCWTDPTGLPKNSIVVRWFNQFSDWAHPHWLHFWVTCSKWRDKHFPKKKTQPTTTNGKPE